MGGRLKKLRYKVESIKLITCPQCAKRSAYGMKDYIVRKITKYVKCSNCNNEFEVK
jgi:transcription elongation factor Elf1